MSLSHAVQPPGPGPSADLPHTSRGGTTLVGLLAAGVVALVFVLFWPRFTELVQVWSIDDNYSHGYLVPVISLMIGWSVLRRQGLPVKGSVGGGLFWVGVGCLFRLWAMIVYWPPVDFVALTTMTYGLLVLVGGREWANGFAFPLMFLLFMFPLPPTLTDRLAVWLQDVVTSGAAFVLRLVVPVYREGNTLNLAGQSLEVGKACSGLGQMMVFPALALLLAHVTPRGFWFRAVIVLSSVPVAIVTNLTRVLLMAAVVMNFGPGAISEKETLVFGISYHTAWGLLGIYGAAAGLFLLLRWLMNRMFPAPREVETKDRPTRPLIVSPLLVRPLLAAAGCLAVTVGVQSLLASHLKAADEVAGPVLQRPLSGVPVSLGAWTGQEVTPDTATLPYFTSADDRLNRLYLLEPTEANRGLACSLFMVFFKDGSDRRHHPLVCYKVAGSAEETSGHAALPLAGQDCPARRFCFTRQGHRSYVFYWHYTLGAEGEDALSPLQRIHQELGVRRPSLTVQIFTTAQTPAQLEQATEFARKVDEELQSYLPPGSKRGSDTLPVKYVGAPRTGDN